MAIFHYDGTEMFYKEIGEGTPFLLIHGWAIDHSFLERCMEPIFAKANGSYKRIYIDVPGMGRSLPGNVKNGDGILRVIEAFMDEMYPGERFYVGGNSYGSVVARAVTAKLTDKVIALLLIAPAMDSKCEGASEGVYRIDEEFMATLDEQEKADFVAMNAKLTREAWERYKELVYPSVRINADNDYMRHKLKGSFGFSIIKALEKKRFKGPVLVVTAKYDTAVGCKAQLIFKDIFTNCTYVVIDGAGHNIHVDQPEEFEKVVLSWLNQCL